MLLCTLSVVTHLAYLVFPTGRFYDQRFALDSLAVVLFNQLIKISGSIFSSSVTYAIPVVALLWGIVDGEDLGLQNGRTADFSHVGARFTRIEGEAGAGWKRDAVPGKQTLRLELVKAHRFNSSFPQSLGNS